MLNGMGKMRTGCQLMRVIWFVVTYYSGCNTFIALPALAINSVARGVSSVSEYFKTRVAGFVDTTFAGEWN